MYWSKIILVSFTIVTFFIFVSCHENTSSNSTQNAVNASVPKWKKIYDSLYDKYSSSKELKFLYQAGVFADSILFLETQLLKDSISQKIFFSALFYRALDLNDLHAFVKSRELLDKYIVLYRQYNLQKKENLEYAKKTISNIFSRYGDYKKAELLLQEGLDYYTSVKDTLEISSCIINLSITLKELHRYEEAINILQKISSLNTVYAKKKAEAYIELADIYSRQQKILEATSQLEKAKKTLSGIPDKIDITDTYADLYNIEGNIQMANGSPQKALIAYQQSLDSARKSSAQNLSIREIGKTYIAMGKALEQLRRPDSALKFYTKALYTVIDVDTTDKFSLPQSKDIYAENTIAEALYARANCIISRNTNNTAELENAVSCYSLAFATESKLLNAFTYDESRLYMINETRTQTEKAISLCYELYKNTNDVHWANEAFLFAEHNKAFVLEESVRRNTAASLYLQNDTLYNQMQQLQNNLALTEIELGKQHFTATPDTALVQALTAAKQKTEEELLAAENNIRIKNPQYNNWLNETTTLSAEDIINKTTDANTSMLEYFSGDASLYAFSAIKNKPLNFYKLNDSVKIIAADFLHFFSNQNLILNNPLQYAAVASHLYQLLAGPYLAKENSNALIIPDGFIAYIPFDALLTGSTTNTNIASFPFLIKQREIFYAFSCKTLLAQAEIKTSTTDGSLLAFAPAFASKERGLSALQHNNEELDAIQQLYPQGKFFSGNAATTKAFESNCSNASIIHLATHASPGNDSLPARIELSDSSIYINSIYAKKMNARLVVLSGCETGTGTLNKSEGLMSLARGFSYAGTKNVIASLWQTEDNSSASIFKDFYSNLSHSSFSSALRNAKLAFLNNASVASASPYYWSGYIYIGTPQENATDIASHAKLKWVAALTSLVLITAYLIFAARRRKKSPR